MGSDTSVKEAEASTEVCYRLIYRSHSLLAPGDTGALADILKIARSRNADLGITGALMLYDDWFAQVLEGPERTVTALYDKIKLDARHENVSLDQQQQVSARLFGHWAMAIVAEHHQPDMPLVATTGGLSHGAPWRVSPDQEQVLTRLRDLTRGYGRGS